MSSSDICGCCNSCEPPWSPAPSCNHGCPEPPYLPPCEDGTYHPCHPLVPMAYSYSCGQTCTTPHQLGCYLKLAETLYTTCQFSGDSYYQVLCYHALALAEYYNRLEIYNTALNAAIALGKTFNVPTPTLYDSGIFGNLLQSLMANTSRPVFFSAI